MEKKRRIHEIAKELKTNSKRLIEKLNEIDIYPKGPMSYLNEEELEALRKHLGIQDDAGQQTKEVERKAVVTRHKDSGRPVTIIKRVVNIIDEDSNKEESKPKRKSRPRKAAESSSGLRPGYVTKESTYDSLTSKLTKKSKSKSTSTNKDEKKKDNIKEKDTKIEKESIAKDKEVTANKEDEIKKVKDENKEVKVATNKVTVNEEDKKDKVQSEEIKESKKEVKGNKETTESVSVSEKEVKAEESKMVAKKEVKIADNIQEKDSKKVEKEIKTKEIEKKEVKDSKDLNKTSKVAFADKVKKVAQKEVEKINLEEDDIIKQKKEKAKKSKPAKKSQDIVDVEVEQPVKKTKGSEPKKVASKDLEDDSKREFKKANKSSGKSKKNNRPEKLLVGEKKDLNEIYSETFALETLDEHDGNAKKRRKKEKRANKGAEQQQQKPKTPTVTKIIIPEVITVKELAESLKKTAAEVITKLLMMGVVATVNQEIDFSTAEIIADEFGVKAELRNEVSEEDILFDDDDDKDDPEAETRPPVVVVMGHVDHGKTSLLDYIRKANVTNREAGGITQHIGAYTAKVNNRSITFLDTPGHEAFTAMRARGAQVTDIAILVVAADDGVMPQTVEAINHAKAANVSIIVAINKIDKPTANVERVKQELAEHGLLPEEWGGDVIFVPVSAKKGDNIDTLLEMVILTADIMELKANPRKQAKGTIIEAQLDKTRGPVATALVQRGTLRVGDSIVTGTTVGRIRAMTNDIGRRIKEAGPSTPVEILGLPDVPQAGEMFHAIKDEKLAKSLAEKRKEKLREEKLKSKAKVSLDDLFNQIQEGTVKELNIIVKADVQGSVEAVKQSLLKLSNDEVRINIVHGAVGAITETDVSLADVTNAVIIGFNVRPGANVDSVAEEAGVDIRLYSVIYNAIEDVEAAMKGMLDPTYKEVIIGHAEVRQIFRVSNIGTIAGCYVQDGKIVRNAQIRLIRDGIVVHTGKLSSLKRFKDDVREVAHNYECGLTIERYNDIKENDIIEAFIMEEVER